MYFEKEGSTFKSRSRPRKSYYKVRDSVRGVDADTEAGNTQELNKKFLQNLELYVFGFTFTALYIQGL